MSKTVKFGIIFFLVLILLFLLTIILGNSDEENIKGYLMSRGYTLESDDETRFFKVVDNTTIDYFSTAEYTMTRNINDKNNSFEYSLTIKYDYKIHELSYNYRIVYGDNTNVIFKGTYNDDNYICDKEFSTITLSSGEIDSNCELIKLKVSRFYKETQVLFNNHQLVEYMEGITLE